MGYIIIWRHNHRDPHIDMTADDLIEVYSSYECAKETADKLIMSEGPDSPWYFDYAIYQKVTS